MKNKFTIYLLVVLLCVLVCSVPFLMLLIGHYTAKVEEHTDVSEYSLYRSGKQALGEYQSKWGMDESIWPESISEDMQVQDYKMVYYNPWDAQFLGYMVVKYNEKAYQTEVKRLQAYPSTKYIGYYGVTGMTRYTLLAIQADAYQGFVYAMTDGDVIIYAEQIFCNYFMDLEYVKYIPNEYLLDGFDATLDNPYRLAIYGHKK
ncbi:MAG: hypothetical protein J6Z00_00900 [Clostridia bacterium]|nr:hypothetical protein [Clostridia bacterium]